MARPPEQPWRRSERARTTASAPNVGQRSSFRAPFPRRRATPSPPSAGCLAGPRAFAPSFAESNGDKGPTRWTCFTRTRGEGDMDARCGAERRAAAQRDTARAPGCRKGIRGQSYNSRGARCRRRFSHLVLRRLRGRLLLASSATTHTRARGRDARPSRNRERAGRGRAGGGVRARGAGKSAQGSPAAPRRGFFAASPGVSPRHWHPQANRR